MASQAPVEASDRVLAAAKVMSVAALQREMEHGYRKELVAAGMPSFDIYSESNAPFLFTDSGKPPAIASPTPGNTGAAAADPQPVSNNPLIKAMVKKKEATL